VVRQITSFVVQCLAVILLQKVMAVEPLNYLSLVGYWSFRRGKRRV